MKQTEFKPCSICGKGMMHDNAITFSRIRLERMMVKLDSIRRQQGLEMVIGNPLFAQVMGLQEDMAVQVCAIECLICDDCTFRTPIFRIYEAETANQNEMAPEREVNEGHS